MSKVKSKENKEGLSMDVPCGGGLVKESHKDPGTGGL